MVTAYILIQTEVGKAAKVAKDIIDITGVLQAQAVTGPYEGHGRRLRASLTLVAGLRTGLPRRGGLTT